MCGAVGGRLTIKFLRKLRWTAQNGDSPLMKSPTDIQPENIQDIQGEEFPSVSEDET